MVIVSGFQTVLLYACLGMLGALALLSFMALVCEPMKRLALRIRKSGHLNALLALLAVAALVAYGGTKPLPVPPEGAEFRVTPYVQHPATNAMSLLWLTDTNATAVVEWWPDGNASDNHYAVIDNPRLATELDYFGYTDPKQCLPSLVPWQYRIRIEDLQPDTKYAYRVTLPGGSTYSNAFRTAPAEFRPVHFVAYSDSETQPSSTGDFNWWENYATDHDTTPGNTRRYYIDQTDGYASNICAMVASRPDFFVIAGDLAEMGSNQTHWDEFWRHNAGELNDPAGSTPILAAPGNHEYHKYAELYGERGMSKFLSYFEFEPNGAAVDADQQERFHRVDYGPVAMIFIDTNNGPDADASKDTNRQLYESSCRAPDFNPGSAQYQWLEEQLADAQTNRLFTFLVCHQCPFSVGYHGRLNGENGTESSAEYLSGAATRCLTNLVFKYGVDAWISGHDELYEHSQLTGTETLPDGTTRSHTINIYDVGMGGDGLRGCNRTGRPNPYEVFRAHVDAPEVYDSTGTLVSGGKHYGHMDVNVTTNSDGLWTATLTPTYVFVSSNTVTGAITFDRRTYPDTIVITNAPTEAAENVIRTETIDGVMWHYIVSNGVAEVTSGTNRPAILPVSYPGEITVPSVLGGFPVMKIGDYAFYYCTGLTDVTIPEGVAIIGDRAFFGCRGLASVTIPNSVMQVGTGVFYGCTNLTSVTLPQYICAGRFKSVFTTASTNITDVVIADGVTNIGASTFSGCRSLESITFNGNAPSVGTGAFSGVSGECTVRVRRDSTGWGVDIPGTWNGLRIEYIDGDAQASSLWYEDPHAVVLAEGLPGQTGNIVHAFHGQGQGEYLGLTYTTNPYQFDLFRVNGTNAPALVTRVPESDLDSPGFRGVAISKALGIAMTLAYAKTTTMYAFPLSGGAPTAVTKPGTHAFDAGAFSPDGRYFFSNALAGETANTYYVKWSVSVANGVVTLTRIGGIAASGRSRNLAYARINGRDLVFGMVDTGKISVIDMTGNTVANWSASDMITDLPAHSYGSLCVSGVNTAGATPHLTVATSYNNGATKGDVLNVYELTVPSSGAVTASLVRSFDEDAMTVAGFGDISDANRYGNTVYVTDDNTTIYFARPDGKLYAYTTAPAGTSEPAEIRNVTAKQRYPWNGLVDIDYTITGDTTGLNLSFSARDAETGATYTPTTFLTTPSSSAGTHRATWNPKADGYSIVSSNIVVTVLLTRTVEVEHEKVQLWEGGPYWATTNIGAEKPEDYGYYFWWGDTVGYTNTGSGWISVKDGTSFSFSSSSCPTYNKDNSALLSAGYIDSTGKLVAAHDAAHVHWGGNWRMPTKAEMDALNSNCDWTWATTNGVNGYIVRGRGNYDSASIFLPCAGYGYGTSLIYAGSYGYFWSSVPSSDYSYCAWGLYFYSGFHGTGNIDRYGGQSVRPVQGFTE